MTTNVSPSPSPSVSPSACATFLLPLPPPPPPLLSCESWLAGSVGEESGGKEMTAEAEGEGEVEGKGISSVSSPVSVEGGDAVGIASGSLAVE